MTAPVMLLDGASLWFRAFHALPEKMTAPDGRPVNAVRGFFDMIASLVTR
ncbi:flap endonuclease, partial [Leifsonia sp. SIMBA_070]